MKPFIKNVLCLLLILSAIAANAQVQLNCCGLNQSIPVFKDDTAFSLAKYYSALIAKKIVPPINESDAQAEIRFIYLGVDMDSDIGIIKCYNNKIVVNRYESVVRVAGTPMVTADEKRYYKNYKDIGVEKPGYKLTNLVKTTNLSAKFKSYNWNAFFKRLIDDRFFDMPAGKAFTDTLKTIYPGNYYSTVYDAQLIIIQIKVGNRYRNLRFDPYGLPKGAPDMDLVKFREDLIQLFENILFGYK